MAHATVAPLTTTSISQDAGEQGHGDGRQERAGQPAGQGDDRGLGHDFAHDLAARRAERPPYADLARLLRDRHERGVGDRRRWPPAAPSRKWGRPRRRRAPRAAGRSRARPRASARRSCRPRRAGAGASPASRSRATLSAASISTSSFARAKMLSVGGGAVDPLEGDEGHPHEPIERRAAGRAEPPLDADDLEPPARDADGLAERVAPGKSASATSAPITATCAPRSASSRCRKRPRPMPEVAQLRQRRRRPADGGVLELACPGRHVTDALHGGGVEHVGAGVALEEPQFGPADRPGCAAASRPARAG